MPYKVVQPPAHLAEPAEGGREEGKRVVAIVGGTGFVGSHLVDEFVRRGHRVYLLGRKFRKERMNPRVDAVIQVDVLDYDGLVSAFQGVDSVVYSALGVPTAFSTLDGIWRVNKFGFENAVKAAQAAGVANFVMISGAHVVGSIRDAQLRSIINALAWAEKYMVAVSEEGDMRTCVMCPGQLVGLRSPIYEEVLAGKMTRFPLLDHRSTFQPVGYLTQAVGSAEEKLATGNKDVVGKVFPLSGEVMSFRKFLSLPSWPHRISHVPLWTLMLLARANRFLARSFNWAPMGADLCPALMGFIYLSEEEVDCSESYHVLELGPPPSMEDYVKSLVEEYKKRK